MLILTPEIFTFEIDLPDNLCPDKEEQIQHYIDLYEVPYLVQMFGGAVAKEFIEGIKSESAEWVDAGEKIARALAHFIWCEWCKEMPTVVAINQYATEDDKAKFVATEQERADCLAKYSMIWNEGVKLANIALWTISVIKAKRVKIKKQYL